MNCNEMGGLGESVHDNPDRIFLSSGQGKPTMKSILMSSHFHMGIDDGWSTPADSNGLLSSGGKYRTRLHTWLYQLSYWTT
jgi:hypothetical protein